MPEPAAGEVLLQVTGAGICGTDSTLARLGEVVVPAGTKPNWPVVIGHEFAGVAVSVGAGVPQNTVGNLYSCGAGVSCGKCSRCRAGQTNLCQRYWTAGVHRDGGLAEFCAVPLAACESATSYGLSPDAAALAQPMAVAEHAVDIGSLVAGERALILGAGGIGAFAVWAAVSRDAHITVYERDTVRLATAAGLGATDTVAATEGLTPLDHLRDHEPFDVVYEMTGGQEPLDAAVALVRPGGRVVAVGIHGAPRPVDLDRVTLQELSVRGTMAHVRCVNLPRALDLLARRREGWADIAPRVVTLETVIGADGAHFNFPAGPSGPQPIKTLIDPSANTTREYR